MKVPSNLCKLLRSFEGHSGFPILLNTSFNGKNEPIVETPEDAVRVARNLGLDVLFIDPFLFLKKNSSIL